MSSRPSFSKAPAPRSGHHVALDAFRRRHVPLTAGPRFRRLGWVAELPSRPATLLPLAIAAGASVGAFAGLALRLF